MMKPISIVSRRRKAAADKRERVNHVKGEIVYLVRAPQADGGIFKIGLTQNLTSRIQTYQGYLGSEVMCLVQIRMVSRETAKRLEAAIIAKLSGGGHIVRGKEWFRMNYYDLRDFMICAIKENAVGIISVHGMPGPIQALCLEHNVLMAEEFASARWLGRNFVPI